MIKVNTTRKPIDATDFDTATSPVSDFYQYANGGWMKNHPLRDEFSRYGTFDQLDEENQLILKELIEDLADKRQYNAGIAKKIGDFYASAMDTSEIEKVGLSPLQAVFQQINKISNRNEIITQVAQLHMQGYSPIFEFTGSPDQKNSSLVIAQLYQGGLGLPDRDYYSDDNERANEIRVEYLKHIAKIFSLAGWNKPEPKAAAARVMEIETRLAAASMTLQEQRDPYKTYNKTNLSELEKLTPGTNWTFFFTSMGLIDPADINIGQPFFFKEVDRMLAEMNMDDWKTYLRWNILNSSAPFLSNVFVNQNFEFYGKVLSGKKELRPRWKRVIDAADDAMGEAIGQIYVSRYFPPEAKQRMILLVDNLKSAFGKRIKDLDWMGDETKKKALEKLQSMKVKIGYPDKWRDFSGIEITGSSYMQNLISASRFNFNFILNKIRKPVDPIEWHMSPQAVNAYYNPLNNEIVFPAGILQPPFFYNEADDAVNYGAIGVVIGHEMTHGFDDQGRKFDKEGNLTDWWTEEDSLKFNEKSQVLAKQFDSFVVMDSTHANGQLTLGENIADLGGLYIAYTAMKLAQKDMPERELIDGFSQDQRFFLAYAHVWAQNIRDKEIFRRTKEDEHSLGRFRVNGPLRNIPAFHKAFDITSGDSMYLPENDKALIW